MSIKARITALCTLFAACGLALSAEGEEYVVGGGGTINLQDTAYVTVNSKCQAESASTLGSTYKGSRFDAVFTNKVVGTYIATWWGGFAGNTAHYKLTVSNSDYTVSHEYDQPNTDTAGKDWSLVSPAQLVLTDLPEGEFVLTFEENDSATRDKYYGNYGFFSIGEVITLPVPEGALAVTNLLANGSLAKTENLASDGDNGNENKAFGSTKKNTCAAFLLKVPEPARYAFSYKCGADNCDAVAEWTLTDATNKTLWTGTDSITNTSSWHCSDLRRHDWGRLDAGIYVLNFAITNCTTTFAGNYGYFAFTRDCTVTVPSAANASLEVKSGATSLGTTNGVYTVTSGNNVTVTYTAGSDYTFDGNSTTNITLANISTDQTITAPTATIKQFTVTVPAVANAALSVTKGSETLGTTNGVYTVDIHSNVSVTYVPEAEYAITNGTATTSFTDISENKEVSAPVLAKMSDIAIGSSIAYISIKDGTDSGKIMLTKCNVDSSNEGKTIGGTGDNTKIAINVYVQETGLYYFSYQYGSEGYTAKLNWKLTDLSGNQVWPAGSGVVVDEIADTGSWTLSPRHEHGFGSLAAGVYVLSAYVSDRTTTTGSHSYAGNYGNFRFGTGAMFGFAAPTSSDYMVISNGLAKSWVTLANCEIDTDSSGAVSNDGKTIGRTGTNTVFSLDLNVAAPADYSLSYMSASSGFSSKLNWALYDVEGSQVWPTSGVVTDTINDNSTWTLTDTHMHSLGSLSTGVYTLRAYVSDQSGVDSSGKYHYAGNFGNFQVIETPVAKIGSKAYTSLAAAVAAGGEITLLKDITLTTPIFVKNTTTIDLAGYTITAAGNLTNNETYNTKDALLCVLYGGDLTINDSSEGKTGKIGAGSISSIYCAIKMTVANDERKGTEVAKLTVNGGTIEGYYYGVSGNGTRHGTEITINGGTIQSTATNEGTGIYNPQEGSLTIAGGTISGYCAAVEIRSGSLKITGGTLTAAATSYSVTGNGNGTTTVGAAVAVSQHSTKKAIDVAIEGGTLSGVMAVSVANAQSATATEFKVKVSITGGTITGGIGVSGDVSGATVSKNSTVEIAAPDGYRWVNNALVAIVPEATEEDVTVTKDSTTDNTYVVSTTSTAATSVTIKNVPTNATLVISSSTITSVTTEPVKKITYSTKPTSVTIKIPSASSTEQFTVTDYYTATESGSTITYALDATKVEPVTTSTTMSMPSTSEAVSIAPGNVKAGFYYSLDAYTSVDGTTAAQAGTAQQATSNGATLSLTNDNLPITSNVLYYRVRVSDTAR